MKQTPATVVFYRPKEDQASRNERASLLEALRKRFQVIVVDLSADVAEHERIEEALQAASPRFVVTDLFPFGHDEYHDAYLQVLVSVRQWNPRPIVISSFGDPSQPRGNTLRDDERCVLMNRFYDRVFMHVDPDSVRLQDVFSPSLPLEVPVQYTGFLEGESPASLPTVYLEERQDTGMALQSIFSPSLPDTQPDTSGHQTSINMMEHLLSETIKPKAPVLLNSRTSKPIRVCLCGVEYPPTIGGAGVSLRRLVGYLVEGGMEVEVFVPLDPMNAIRDVSVSEEDGAKIHRVKHTRDIFVQMHTLMKEADERNPFDIFHGFYLPWAYPCIGVAGENRPLIASIRGDDAVGDLEIPGRNLVAKLVAKRATWITSVSSDLLRNLAPLADIANRSSVVFNAIAPHTGHLWRGPEANRGVVGTVGKFREKKDIPLLARAYAGLKPSLRKQLLMAGYFPCTHQERAVMDLGRDHRLVKEFKITGRLSLSEVKEQLAEMHVFVQSSKHEGLPNALLEAASVGVPLVATCVGGAPDILIDEYDGLLIPPGDEKQLIDAIEAVLSNDDLASKLSQGAARVAQRLGPDQEKQAWYDLYEKVMYETTNAV